MESSGLKNIETVKVNPYEIAKASDMDFAFKNVLSHLTVVTDWFYGSHKAQISDKLFKQPTTGQVGTVKKDFIIGGGFVSGGDRLLKPLPIVAHSHSGGIFITNGLDVNNRPYVIEIGKDFEVDGYRIESIFIGNAWAEDETLGGSLDKNKVDPNWDEYASEWRAGFKLGAGSNDTVFSEFKKRQKQAVRFYVLPGIIARTEEQAYAADSSKLDAYKNRVKIAEVLVHCVTDSGNVPHIQPLKKDDVRFVTARCYFDGNYEEAKLKDSGQVEQVKTVVANIPPGVSSEEADRLREEAKNKTLDNKAGRAEHYNFRWTQEKTRTYIIGSVAEISERLYKIHKEDGTLKEAVVKNQHIDLHPMSGESLRGDLIPVGQSDGGSGAYAIQLPYGKKIISHENIKKGLLNIAEAMIEHVDRTEDVHGATSKPEPNRIAIRDENGILEVADADPNEGKHTVNVDFLNAAFNGFQLSIFLKLLKSKLITNQSAFNTWIAQRNNEAYTYVYLKGEFTVNATIDLPQIGTEEVIGLEKPLIKGSANNCCVLGSSKNTTKISNIKIDFTGGGDDNVLVGIKNANVENCEVKVIGNTAPDGPFREALAWNNWEGGFVPPSDGYDGVSAVGFFDSKIRNCTVEVIGGNGGWPRQKVGPNGKPFWGDTYSGDRGGDGGDAIGFVKCEISGNCSITAIGGNAGMGGTGTVPTRDSSDYDAGGGGNGGNGGVAKTAQDCLLDSNLNLEQDIQSGNGGKGGNPGLYIRRSGYWGKTGFPGDAGKSGDVYIFKKYNYHYKIGFYYHKKCIISYQGYNHNEIEKCGKEGSYGKVIYIE